MANVLQKQGFYNKDIDGNFGPYTMQATRAFQQYYSIQQTGTAGSLTLSKAYSLGFNPDNEPVTPPINSDAKMMQWIKDNLGTFIKTAIANTNFTEDWLAAICARETGFLFTRYANQGLAFDNITALMKGFQRAVTAAYNCGEGNVCKALKRGLDVDCYTYAKDYSAEVFRYRNIYKNLQST